MNQSLGFAKKRIGGRRIAALDAGEGLRVSARGTTDIACEALT